MKNKIIIILLVIILICLLFFSSNFINSETKKTLEKYIVTSGETTGISGSSSNKTSNEMSNFSEELLSNIISEENFEDLVLKSKGKVLVDFYADWCQPCTILAPVLDEVLSNHPEITYYKINVDVSETLCSKYRIYYIPTLIIFSNGTETNRSTGLIEKEQIEELIK